MGDEGQQEKEGVKSKDETKDERRKRLHARNMRYYRSFESFLVANMMYIVIYPIL